LLHYRVTTGHYTLSLHDALPIFFLRLRAINFYRFGTAKTCGQKWCTAQRSTSLMRDQTKLDQTEFQSAICFGHSQSGPALLLCNVPETFVIFASRFQKR